jgi:hypothetical protein
MKIKRPSRILLAVNTQKLNENWKQGSSPNPEISVVIRGLCIEVLIIGDKIGLLAKATEGNEIYPTQ